MRYEQRRRIFGKFRIVNKVNKYMNKEGDHRNAL